MTTFKSTSSISANSISAKKLLYFISDDHYVCSHRLNLAKMAKDNGFVVAIATRCSHHQQVIEEAGLKVFPLRHLTRSGINPLQQWRLLQELWHIYKNFQPDIVHHVAMKPVIIGSIIAKFCKVPKVINALGGLGYLFTDIEQSNESSRKISSQSSKNASSKNVLQDSKKKLLQKVVVFLLKRIFSRSNNILILQNKDDIRTLERLQIISKVQSNVKLIPGAGVDLDAFPFSKPKEQDSPIIIACVARMLWDKGIGELVEASQILKENFKPHPNIEIRLHGMPDEENPASITLSQLTAWHQSGVINWRGHCSNVAEAYADCHIATLPSYREGMPKSLLEAMSIGRPIVTTDVPGCRDIVKEGENGYLVPAREPKVLASALLRLIENKALRIKMGEAGRKMVEQHYSDVIINQQTVALYP